jgi:hypothetical protein
MSISSYNPARRWAAELRAWGRFRWHGWHSGLWFFRSTLVFWAVVILWSIGLVVLLVIGPGSAPRSLGGAFTIEVTDEGVPYVALDPQGLEQAQGGAIKADGASGGSSSSAVALFPVDTSGGVLSLVGGGGSSAGNDPQPPPGPKPGPGPSPVPSPGPSPSPTPPPTSTEPPPTSTEPPPTSTEPPPTSTEPPPTSTEPPQPSID